MEVATNVYHHFFRLNIMLLHVADNLVGNFLENSLRQRMLAVLNLLKVYELNDVSFRHFPEVISQKAIITIKYLHIYEVMVAQSDNYNSARQF